MYTKQSRPCACPQYGATQVCYLVLTTARCAHIVMLRPLIWPLFASGSAVDCSVLIMFQVAIRTLGIEVAKRFAFWRSKLGNFTFPERVSAALSNTTAEQRLIWSCSNYHQHQAGPDTGTPPLANTKAAGTLVLGRTRGTLTHSLFLVDG